MPDNNASSIDESPSFDYSYAPNPARIAVYDDFKSPPRIVTIEPTTTNEFIEHLASSIYDLSHALKGSISYTVIREVTENLIHARFTEIVVSIYDEGNTIRFSDQGPGIHDKERAQKPGYTSAIEPMKRYIRGVGSGLPTVKEYLAISNGHITIDDNIGTGAIVTISLKSELPEEHDVGGEIQDLNDQERDILSLFATGDVLGITDIVKRTGKPQSSVSYQLDKLMESGLVEKTASKKRKVTEHGRVLAEYLTARSS